MENKLNRQFLKKKEHHELLSGMELVDQNQEYLAMVEQNYQQAGADLQEYINEYDGLPQQWVECETECDKGWYGLACACFTVHVDDDGNAIM